MHFFKLIKLAFVLALMDNYVLEFLNFFLNITDTSNFKLNHLYLPSADMTMPKVTSDLLMLDPSVSLSLQ